MLLVYNIIERRIVVGQSRIGFVEIITSFLLLLSWYFNIYRFSLHYFPLSLIYGNDKQFQLS